MWHFPSAELGQCTDWVPTLSKSSEPAASGSQQVQGGHEESEEKICQKGGKGFSEITATTAPAARVPACVVSSLEWARLIKNSLLINSRGISLVFWHTTQQHMRAAQLRDALPPGSPSLTPQTTSHPFLEAWAHTTFSRIRGITLGVYVRLLQLCV